VFDYGSVDNSFEIFADYNLKFNKKQLKLNKNQGRSYARSEGIKIASGEWILFLNSNIIVEATLLLRYSESMLNRNSYAYGGCINYSSIDSVFEKYLNKSTRGIKKYKNNQNISYQNLLFSNCIIKKSVFDVIELNLNLKYYGGEELDFASKLEKKFPKMMTASTGAVATRINFPDYKKHLYKLIEFGELNLKYLDNIPF
jgi:glycosyltransferase involved in cell wall biosynthesis